jgi:proteic killer suppression protein
VILSFKSAAAEALWLGQRPPELPSTILKAALRRLTQLNSIQKLHELQIPPGNHIEALKGDRKGQHSIRVNDQYRVCFRWDGQNVREVEILDYH